ncbi:MAG: hypothetical protein ACYTEG_16645 [Planctomycetota bacterium]|jgi:hypothetical protein
MAPSKKSGPETLKAGRHARKVVAAILEALSGEIGTSEAAALLGISLSRYYQLETRALQGMLTAMEPRKRGKQKTPQGEIRALKAQKREVEQELRRHQSLLRAANRSLGLAAKGRKKASSKGRARKRGVRGKTVLQTLRAGAVDEEGAGDGKAQRDGTAGGSDRGERAGA